MSTINLPNAEQLLEQEHHMVGLGQRLGGTASHRRWLDFLEDRFQRAGLDTFRTTQPLTAAEPLSEAVRWSLVVVTPSGVQRPVPVAAYRPGSGANGHPVVTAELVDVGAGTQAEFEAARPEGKIALVTSTLPSEYENYDVWYPDMLWLHDPAQTITPDTPFRKTCFNVMSPALNDSPEFARAAGCVGLVIALDAEASGAAGQYVPFARPLCDLPVLYVDRPTGSSLKSQLATEKLVTQLELETRIGPASVDNLTAVLPGSEPECIWLLSHSDGVNACQENGAIALVALAEAWAAKPKSDRRRSLAFHLSLHMTPYASTNGSDLEADHPDLYAQVVALLHMEHFGQRAWYDDKAAGMHRDTGEPEVRWMDVSANPTLIESVKAAVSAEDLRRTAIMSKTFSVGARFTNELPTVGLMTYPDQMLGAGETRDFKTFSQNLDKFDATQMRSELAVMARVLADVDAMETGALAAGTKLAARL